MNYLEVLIPLNLNKGNKKDSKISSKGKNNMDMLIDIIFPSHDFLLLLLIDYKLQKLILFTF